MVRNNDKTVALKRSKRREVFLALALMSPYIISFVVFTFIPVILGVVFSFMRYNPYLPEENEFIGFQNYLNIFSALAEFALSPIANIFDVLIAPISSALTCATVLL